jgi:hypothetical protein
MRRDSRLPALDSIGFEKTSGASEDRTVGDIVQ